MKMLKRVLAVFLAVLLMCGSLAEAAFASSGEPVVPDLGADIVVPEEEPADAPDTGEPGDLPEIDEPAPEVTAEPAPEATEEPVPEATAEPAPEATEELAPETTEEPAPEEQPVEPAEPVDEPATPSVSEPEDQPEAASIIGPSEVRARETITLTGSNTWGRDCSWSASPDGIVEIDSRGFLGGESSVAEVTGKRPGQVTIYYDYEAWEGWTTDSKTITVLEWVPKVYLYLKVTGSPEVLQKYGVSSGQFVTLGYLEVPGSVFAGGGIDIYDLPEIGKNSDITYGQGLAAVSQYVNAYLANVSRYGANSRLPLVPENLTWTDLKWCYDAPGYGSGNSWHLDGTLALEDASEPHQVIYRYGGDIPLEYINREPKDGNTYLPGESYTVLSEPAVGTTVRVLSDNNNLLQEYVFDGWKIDGAGDVVSGTRQEMGDHSVTITGSWRRTFNRTEDSYKVRVAYRTDDDATGRVDWEGAWYAWDWFYAPIINSAEEGGAEFLIYATAIPNYGYAFDYWSMEYVGKVERLSDGAALHRTFPYDANADDYTFRAHFKKLPVHYVSYIVRGDIPEGFTIPEAQEYPLDWSYALPEAPEPLYVYDAYNNFTGVYTFDGWRDADGNIVSGDQTVGDGDVTYYGEWTFTKASVPTPPPEPADPEPVNGGLSVTMSVKVNGAETHRAKAGDTVTFAITVENMDTHYGIRGVTVAEDWDGNAAGPLGWKAPSSFGLSVKYPGADPKYIQRTFEATYVVKAEDSGKVLWNSASATGELDDYPVAVKGSDSTYVIVDPLDTSGPQENSDGGLTVKVTADPASVREAGEKVRFTITVTNDIPRVLGEDASGFNGYDPLGAVAVSAPALTAAGAAVPESIGALRAGETWTGTYEYTVTESDIAKGQIVSAATASAAYKQLGAGGTSGWATDVPVTGTGVAVVSVDRGYSVRYQWSGLPAEQPANSDPLPTLPGPEEYRLGETVTADAAYSKGDVYEVKNGAGKVIERYMFNGWTVPNWGRIDRRGLIITGTWTKVISDSAEAAYDWDNGTWTWAEDCRSATFTVPRQGGGEALVLEAAVTAGSEVPAACTEGGHRTYTATVTAEGKELTDTRTVDTPPLGHLWSGAASWSADNTQATVTFTCGRDASHRESVTLNATSSVTKEPTCADPGVRTYTVDAAAKAQELNAGDGIFTAAVAIPATGHDWDTEGDVFPLEPGVEGDQTTVTIFCKNDKAHTQTVYAKLKKVDSQPATCTEEGFVKYQMTFEVNGEEHELVPVNYTVPKRPHTWGPWEKQDDASAAATADTTEAYVHTCQVCGTEETEDHIHTYAFPAEVQWDIADNGDAISVAAVLTCEEGESETLVYSGEDITSRVIKEATCTEQGQVEYTVTATVDGASQTYTKTAAIPATGHVWDVEDTVTWNEDHSEATFAFECILCQEKRTVTAPATSTEILPAGCETKGTALYSAETELDGTYASVQQSVAIPATGHDWDVTGEDIPLVPGVEGSFTTVTITCRNDHSHTRTAYASLSLVKDKCLKPTCTEPGKDVYQMAYTVDGETYTLGGEAEYTIPALGHLWDKDGKCARCGAAGGPTGTWLLPKADDTAPRVQWSQPEPGMRPYLTVTVECVDENGTVTGTEKIVVAGDDIRTEPGTDPTCTEPGTTKYSGTVELDGKSVTYTYTKTDRAPMGHWWRVSEDDIEWSADDSEVTFHFRCRWNEDHREDVTAAAEQTVLEPASCTEAGEKLLSATARMGGTTASAQKTAPAPALGHDFHDGVCSRCGAEDPNYAAPTPTPETTPTPTPETTPTAAPEATPAATPTAAPGTGGTGTGGTGTGKPTAPDTGDETALLPWTLMLLACGGALVLLTRRRRPDGRSR